MRQRSARVLGPCAWIAALLLAFLGAAPAAAQEDTAAAEAAASEGGAAAEEVAATAQAAAPAEGRMVSVRTAYSTSFDAYLAGPRDARLGVLLVHDRWGLNPQVKAWADRVAALGHRVLAVDLYDGRPVGKPAQGIAVWRSIDPVWTEANLNGALAFMRSGHERVVALGWGKGIGPVGELAGRAPDALAGLVLYYDADTLEEARRLPARPAMPVLDITVGRSLVHPRQDRSAASGGAEEAWRATQQFLARFAE